MITSTNNQESLSRTCAYCHSKEDPNKNNEVNKKIQLKRCSLCKEVYYCSRECQIKDWKNHKKICYKEGEPKYNEVFKRSTTTTGVSQKDLSKKTKICNFCKRKERLDDGEKFKKCMKCRKVYYCGEECQIKDWKKHKKTCNINMQSLHWRNHFANLSFNEIIDLLKGKGKYVNFINDIKNNHSDHFVGNMGLMIRIYESRLINLLHKHYVRADAEYYQLLQEQKYVKKTRTIKDLTSGSPVLSAFEGDRLSFITTKKGYKNLDNIQKIALDCCLNVLEQYFYLMLGKDIELKRILEDEKIYKLIENRKIFLFGFFCDLLKKYKKDINAFIGYLIKKRYAKKGIIKLSKSEYEKEFYSDSPSGTIKKGAIDFIVKQITDDHVILEKICLSNQVKYNDCIKVLNYLKK